jgi:hypothetical protein
MASEKLIRLLRTGEFDWENVYHRQAFMKAWLNGDEELRKMLTGDEKLPPPAE